MVAPQTGTLPASPAAEENSQPASHRIERDLVAELRRCDDVTFDSLIVRQTPNGVCVQGTVHGTYDRSRIAEIIRDLAGVDQVVDQVISQNN